MAYRIEYDTKNGKYEIATKAAPNLAAMTMLMFVLFLLLACIFWPEGAEVVRDVVIPGDDEVTLHAMECFAEEIQNGVRAYDAITNFCREIIHSAAASD